MTITELGNFFIMGIQKHVTAFCFFLLLFLSFVVFGDREKKVTHAFYLFSCLFLALSLKCMCVYMCVYFIKIIVVVESIP